MADEDKEFDLEGAADKAILACNGDQRDAIKSLIVMNHYLAKELEFAWQPASPGYTRQKKRRKAAK
jgi:hypothetical protein